MLKNLVLSETRDVLLEVLLKESQNDQSGAPRQGPVTQVLFH